MQPQLLVKRLHNVVFDEDIKCIDVDTRDMECVLNDFNLKLVFNKEFAEKSPEKYIYTIEEIRETLIKIEKDSGGEANWRFLVYPEFKETSNWLKYIFIRCIGPNKYVMLVEKSSNRNKNKYLCTLLSKQIWISKIADPDILCTH